MKKIRIDKLTCAEPKNIAKPKTVQEKYDKLNKKNPNLDLLKNTFGLELSL